MPACEFGIVRDYEMSPRTPRWWWCWPPAMHDIGMSIHRTNHEQYSLILAAPKIRQLLTGIYDEPERTIVTSEALHAIISHRSDMRGLTAEAGCVKVADALDMAKGRSRIPFEAGKIDVHSLSAAAIDAVTISKGAAKPIGIAVAMNNSAGMFQLDELLKPKIADLGHRRPRRGHRQHRRRDRAPPAAGLQHLMPTAGRRPLPSQATGSARKRQKLEARSRLQAQARSRRSRRATILATAVLAVLLAAALLVHIATAPPADDARTLSTSHPSGSAVAWSPDGRLVAEAASAGGTIGIWDAARATVVHTIAPPAGPITALAWSADGRYLAAGVAAAATKQATQPVATTHGRTGGARRAATRPNTYLFHIWATDSWAERTEALRSLAGPVASALAFSPEGRRLAAQDSQG